MSIKLGPNLPAMPPQTTQVGNPPAAPSAPPHGPVCMPGDGFDAKPARGPTASKPPPTIDDLKNGLLASPEFKKMSKGAQTALLHALPFVKDPKGLKALDDEMNSKWFQGLPAGDQEKTMKSLLNEVLSPLDKIQMRQREMIENIR